MNSPSSTILAKRGYMKSVSRISRAGFPVGNMLKILVGQADVKTDTPLLCQGSNGWKKSNPMPLVSQPGSGYYYL